MNYKCKLVIQYAVLTVLSIVVYQAFIIPNFQIHRIEFVLNAIITTTTTISGFILTSLSILLGLNNHPILEDIKKKTIDGRARLAVCRKFSYWTHNYHMVHFFGCNA